MSKAFLIFTGHNDRAVIALCRAMSVRKLPFCLVAKSGDDQIFKTSWGDCVSYIRSDSRVDQFLFESIRHAVDEKITLIYCPTTEYINVFVLENRKYLEALGIHVPLPPSDIYNQLTSKKQSLNLIQEICDLAAPMKIDWEQAAAPCVFKPNANISNRSVNYPILCFSQREVNETRRRLNPNKWFVQRYIDGQSHYICGYLSTDARYQFYWQTNLMQQPNGKSIVLARIGINPGLDVNRFFDGLAKLGYFGPIMMEIIEDTGGKLYYVEINPRFWGPLQLAVDACPEMFNLYFDDVTCCNWPASLNVTEKSVRSWYAWEKGAQMHHCRLYPAAEHYSNEELQILLSAHDIYRHDDSRAIYEASLTAP